MEKLKKVRHAVKLFRFEKILTFEKILNFFISSQHSSAIYCHFEGFFLNV